MCVIQCITVGLPLIVLTGLDAPCYTVYNIAQRGPPSDRLNWSRCDVAARQILGQKKPDPLGGQVTRLLG